MEEEIKIFFQFLNILESNFRSKMKNRIESKFLELRKKNQKALIAFVTAGDPNINISKKILNILNEQKVDIIEIGFPFSDPMADGPTIQKSSQRAIKAGTNLKSTFKLVNDFRKKERKTPIILMGYFNPIFQFGLERFFKKCNAVGVDGLIIVDLPPEENHYIYEYTNKYDVHNIRLLTPTTHKKRLQHILKHTDGFLYYVSVMGITGTKKPSIIEVEKSVKKIRKMSKLPICVGFGIKSRNQIKHLNKFSDGCVVGSALVSLVEEFDNGKVNENTMLKNISNFLTNLKN